MKRLKDWLKSLPIIGTPFNAAEKTDEYELDEGLKVKEYKGDAAFEKMGEIDILEKEIRLLDTEWLKNDLLAHELAHWERYKEGSLINKISGHFGDLIFFPIVLGVILKIVELFGIISQSVFNWVAIPFAGSIAILLIAVKLAEEEYAEKKKAEVKEKYGLSNGGGPS